MAIAIEKYNGLLERNFLSQQLKIAITIAIDIKILYLLCSQITPNEFLLVL